MSKACPVCHAGLGDDDNDCMGCGWGCIGFGAPTQIEVQTELDRCRKLLSMAIAFDGGPPVEVNGHRWEPTWADAKRYNCRVEKRGDGSWAALDFVGACLNRHGEWEYEPSPSARDEDFKDRARFKTYDDALEALSRWRQRS